MDALVLRSPQYWIMKAVLGGYNPPGYTKDRLTPFGVIDNYLYNEDVRRRSGMHATRIIERLESEGYAITDRRQVLSEPLTTPFPPPDHWPAN